MARKLKSPTQVQLQVIGAIAEVFLKVIGAIAEVFLKVFVVPELIRKGILVETKDGWIIKTDARPSHPAQVVQKAITERQQLEQQLRADFVDPFAEAMAKAGHKP